MVIWKDIKGFEGLYKVSEKGSIYSIPRPGTKGGILKYKDDGEYYRVLLYKDGVGKQFLVHRILMETFIPNPLKKTQVNHIDGDKTNNDLNNLEWVTRSENQLHAYAAGLQKVNIAEAHKVRHEQTKRKVMQLSMDGKELKTFNSIKEASKHIGRKDCSKISAVAKGKRKSTGGFKWEYIS